MKRTLTLTLLMWMGLSLSMPLSAQLLASLAKGKKKDNGITNDLHAKYVKQLIFTSESYGPDEISEDKIKTEFTVGEPIHFRAYFEESLVNSLVNKTRGTSNSIVGVHARHKFALILDGGEPYEFYTSESQFDRDEKETWTTWRGGFYHAEGKTMIGSSGFKRFLVEKESELTEGEHTLRVEIYPYISYPNDKTGELVASGEIKLSVKASIVDPNDPQVCLPQANMSDPELETKIMAAFKKKGWKEIPQKVIITGERWVTLRHPDTGIVLARTIEAVVASTRGDECIYQFFNFNQDHDGSNYQSYTYMNGIGSQRNVPCACFKGIDR